MIKKLFNSDIMETFFHDMPEKVLVTGIGTDVGKSWATGWLARELMTKARVNPSDSRSAVITQKLIQTGNKEFSEDIDVHRGVMGTGLLPRDLDHTTASIILSYPASPELAARIDGVEVDFEVAAKSTERLSTEYRHVLIEGAGGLLVPLHRRYTTLDYVAEHKLPVIVVTNGQLGSINHTLLTLEALMHRDVEIYGVVYNPYFDKDKVISADTVEYVREWVTDNLPSAKFVVMPDKI